MQCSPGTVEFAAVRSRLAEIKQALSLRHAVLLEQGEVCEGSNRFAYRCNRHAGTMQRIVLDYCVIRQDGSAHGPPEMLQKIQRFLAE